jgi:acetyltransferase-like isoleucine patch superfamily enzyme
MNTLIDETAVIGEDFVCGAGVTIESGVVLGDEVTIGNYVTIYAGTIVESGVTISDFAVIGRQPKLSPRSTANRQPLGTLVLGAGAFVGSHTVLMAGTTIGDRVIVGDNAGVRERCTIGNDVVIGRSVTIENDTEIGARTKIQTGSYITAYVMIEEDVFIAPMVVTTNDNYMGRTEKRHALIAGCTIRRGARVGGGVHIAPSVEIGEEAFIGVGAVVTHDIPPRVLAYGVPAKVHREVPSEEFLEGGS